MSIYDEGVTGCARSIKSETELSISEKNIIDRLFARPAVINAIKEYYKSSSSCQSGYQGVVAALSKHVSEYYPPDIELREFVKMFTIQSTSGPRPAPAVYESAVQKHINDIVAERSVHERLLESLKYHIETLARLCPKSAEALRAVPSHQIRGPALAQLTNTLDAISVAAIMDGNSVISAAADAAICLFDACFPEPSEYKNSRTRPHPRLREGEDEGEKAACELGKQMEPAPKRIKVDDPPGKMSSSPPPPPPPQESDSDSSEDSDVPWP